MDTHGILEIIDEHKEKMPDCVYKELCDKMAELNNKKTKYARVEGIMLFPAYSCDSCSIHDERVNLLVEVGEECGCEYEIETGKICNQYFKSLNESISKHGYTKVLYNVQNDSYLIVLKIEMINA